jgi:hypothetical protein
MAEVLLLFLSKEANLLCVAWRCSKVLLMVVVMPFGKVESNKQAVHIVLEVLGGADMG